MSIYSELVNVPPLEDQKLHKAAHTHARIDAHE